MNKSNSYSVLIIDDDEFLSSYMAEKFKTTTSKITICNDSSKALQTVIKLKPQLIIIDVQMQPINGFDLGLEIKKIPELEDIPIVFISASNNKDYPVIAFTLGAAAFLTKPLDMDILLQEAELLMDMCQFKRLAKKVYQHAD